MLRGALFGKGVSSLGVWQTTAQLPSFGSHSPDSAHKVAQSASVAAWQNLPLKWQWPARLHRSDNAQSSSDLDSYSLTFDI